MENFKYFIGGVLIVATTIALYLDLFERIGNYIDDIGD